MSEQPVEEPEDIGEDDFVPEDFGPEDEPEEAKGATRERTPFPLPEGDYFGPPVTSRAAHSGGRPSDVGHVKRLQEAVKANADGQYGQATEHFVREAQQENGLPITGLVDAKTWDGIVG